MENLGLAISSLFQAALRHAQDEEGGHETADTIARQFSACLSVGCAGNLGVYDELDSLDVIFDELEYN